MKSDQAMAKLWFIFAGAYGFLAVAFGAFAAHGMRETASERALNAIETGSHYALAHAVALLALGLWGASGWAATGAGATFAAGVLIFTGSLYVYGLTEYTGHLWITPIGGVLLLAGWAFVMAAGLAAR